MEAILFILLVCVVGTAVSCIANIHCEYMENINYLKRMYGYKLEHVKNKELEMLKRKLIIDTISLIIAGLIFSSVIVGVGYIF